MTTIGTEEPLAVAVVAAIRTGDAAGRSAADQLVA